MAWCHPRPYNPRRSYRVTLMSRALLRRTDCQHISHSMVLLQKIVHLEEIPWDPQWSLHLTVVWQTTAFPFPHPLWMYLTRGWSSTKCPSCRDMSEIFAWHMQTSILWAMKRRHQLCPCQENHESRKPILFPTLTVIMSLLRKEMQDQTKMRILWWMLIATCNRRTTP